MGNSFLSFGQAQSRKRDTKRVVLATALVALLVIAIAFAASSCASIQSQPSGAATGAVDAQQTDASAAQGDGAAGATAGEPTQITVTFAGDCTLGTDSSFDQATSFNAKYDEVEDPAYFLRNVADLFGADDLTVVNMEGTLTTSGQRADKTFAFKGDADYARVLSSSSVEAASMANNHSQDYGQESFTDTIEALDAQGIRSFGYDDVAMMDVKGAKVALIGAYELAEGEAIIDHLQQQIRQARADGADLVLVYAHWGIELDTVPTRSQMNIGHAAIDAGADLVVGSHPHVIQGWELYQGRYIVYSLGNFCFGGNANPTDTDCMLFQQTFTLVPNGDVASSQESADSHGAASSQDAADAQSGEGGASRFTVEKNEDVRFIACSVSSSDAINNYQPTLAEGEDKARIERKIADSSEQIAAMAA